MPMVSATIVSHMPVSVIEVIWRLTRAYTDDMSDPSAKDQITLHLGLYTDLAPASGWDSGHAAQQLVSFAV